MCDIWNKKKLLCERKTVKMNSKDNKYLVTDAKALNKSSFQSSNSNKSPLNGVSKTVNGSSSATKDARQAFFSSSTSTSSSTSKYKESSQKSYTTTTKVTTSSWTTSAAAAAESKNFLKNTSLSSKYPPAENKYNSYSSINKDASHQTPTNSIFYSFDKSGQRPFGSDIQSSKYISPYRGQSAQQNPYTVKSASETAKWSDLKTNPALYKKPTAAINSIQKPLGSLLLTTAAVGSVSGKTEPQTTSNVSVNSIRSSVNPAATTSG